MSDWVPAAYQPQYFDQLLEMSRQQYGADNDICDGAFLRHQYFENPAGSALIDLAVDSRTGVLAGQYVVSPARFLCFGSEVRCVTSLNTLTNEAYRGQGVFTGLAERTYARAKAEGFAFVYGAPNKNSYHGFIKKLSFEDIHHFPLYVRPLDASQMVRERFGSRGLAAAARPFNLFFRGVSGRYDGIAELTEQNCGLMDGFWQSVKGKYPIMGVRDAEYIRYRYLTVPRRRYHPLVALHEGEPVAFAVGRVREVAGFQCGMIADFLYLPGFERQGRELIATLVERLRGAGASLAGCAILAHTAEARQLRRCGFFRCPDLVLPQPTPIILRLFDEQLREKGISDIHNWFFTTGDYDVV